jgi:UDP-glucuronate decarboxylase
MAKEFYHLQDDLDAIFGALEADWRDLRGARLFVTGGTGFIGRWMLEALCNANRRLGLGIETVVLSRNPGRFRQHAPHLFDEPTISFLSEDIEKFSLKDSRFSHIIHGATDASAELNERDPRRMFSTIVTGTQRVLDFAEHSGAERMLLMSSGAVYGQQPWDLSHVPETWRGGPDPQDPRAAYAEGKRAAEMMSAIYGKQLGLDVVTARIFALLGPMLAPDIHFAAGNFIRDSLAGRPIRVEGSGKAVRSYLYAADLTVWLWKIIICAPKGAVYNVGSEDAISISELAHLVSETLGAGSVQVLGKPDLGWNPGKYVPSTKRIQDTLGVKANVSLVDSIRRTALSYGGIKWR